MAILRRSISGAFDAPAPSSEVQRGHTAPLPIGCDIALVRTAGDLEALAGPWKRLEQQATGGHHIFQSHDWLMAWAETYAPRLVIAAGRRNGELAFAWPLMQIRVGPVKILRWLAEPHSQYGDVLAAPGECPRMWAAAALEQLVRDSKADVIRLRHVREDALVAPYLDTAFRRSNMDDRAPSLDLTVFADEAAYEARYTSAQRKRRKKIRKALEETFGPLRYEIVEDGPAGSAVIATILAEKSRWVDDRGRHNRILSCPVLRDFLDRLAAREEGRVIVSQLTAGIQPVSWDIGLRHRGTHFCFITAHVNALTDFSPARLHMDFSQRQALRDGMKTFDLMVPDDPYKDSWCSGRTPTHDYHLPLTAVGKLYGTGYLENLRPVLREAYHHAPPAMLKLLKPVMGH